MANLARGSAARSQLGKTSTPPASRKSVRMGRLRGTHQLSRETAAAIGTRARLARCGVRATDDPGADRAPMIALRSPCADDRARATLAVCRRQEAAIGRERSPRYRG